MECGQNERVICAELEKDLENLRQQYSIPRSLFYKLLMEIGKAKAFE